MLSVPSLAAYTLGFVLLHRERGECEARHLADIDHLTGLQNRRGFEALFARALRYAAETGAWTSLALIDIDHFKAVNDLHGHVFAQTTGDFLHGFEIFVDDLPGPVGDLVAPQFGAGYVEDDAADDALRLDGEDGDAKDPVALAQGVAVDVGFGFECPAKQGVKRHDLFKGRPFHDAGLSCLCGSAGRTRRCAS